MSSSSHEHQGAPLDSRSRGVVVPTYNEAENLPELASRLFALGRG